MGEFLLYMLFSTIEGFSVYAITLYAFRYNLKRYLWPVLGIVTLLNLFGYGLSYEPDYSYLNPIINIIFTILFMALFVRVPILWAMVVGVSGYFAFGLIQVTVVLLSFGYLSINEVQTVATKGYLLQTITGFIGTYISWLAYKFGYGFSFDFAPHRKRWEQMLIILIISILLVWLAVMLYFKHAPIIFLLFAFALVVSLIYAIRKENEEG